MVKEKLQQGVTLIELLVVVGIFTIVSAILLFNFSDFSTNVSIRNLSQDIALSIRKAQSYATSSRSINSDSLLSSQFPTYGISFTVGGEISPDNMYPDPKQFIVFADVGTPGDRIYKNDNDGECGNPSDNNECIESLGITSADRITQICTDRNCYDDGTVNILFHRPAPDADICVVKDDVCEDEKFAFVDIRVVSIKGVERIVSVWNTGQIGIK